MIYKTDCSLNLAEKRDNLDCFLWVERDSLGLATGVERSVAGLFLYSKNQIKIDTDKIISRT